MTESTGESLYALRQSYLVAVAAMGREGRTIAAGLAADNFRVVLHDRLDEPESAHELMRMRPSVILMCGDPVKHRCVKEFIDVVRSKRSEPPTWITALTDDDTSKRPLSGLRMGADDLLPLRHSVLADVALVLDRRMSWIAPSIRQGIYARPLTLVPVERRVLAPDLEAQLGHHQFAVLMLLVREGPEVVSSEALRDLLEGFTGKRPTANGLQQTMRRIRKHLGPYRDKIVTVRGRGYQFDGRVEHLGA